MIAPAWPVSDCAEDIAVIRATGVSRAEVRRVQAKLDARRLACWMVKYLNLRWL